MGSERTAVKLPPRRALAALRDIERNDGFMRGPSTAQEAAMLWRDLRRRGWVEGYSITNLGRRALGDSDEQ